MTREQARHHLSGRGYEARAQAALQASQRQRTDNTSERRS
jgi:hypothetical protein